MSSALDLPVPATVAPSAHATATVPILAMAVGGFGIGTGEFAIMGLLPEAVADLGADVLDELLGDVRRGPGGLEPGHLVEEAGEHLLAVRGVHDLRVILHAGHLALDALERGHGRTRSRRGALFDRTRTARRAGSSRA